jgi:hypothetical protein
MALGAPSLALKRRYGGNRRSFLLVATSTNVLALAVFSEQLMVQNHNSQTPSHGRYAAYDRQRIGSGVLAAQLLLEDPELLANVVALIVEFRSGCRALASRGVRGSAHKK